jgi:type II secretory ATPase GspE/PulE/Tfp pilus assembly ATPase PilB-like protein
MNVRPLELLESRWAGLRRDDPQQVSALVTGLLAAAREVGASDVHLIPRPSGLQVQWRRHGVMEPAALLPATIAANVAARLKVLAELLTYRTDLPQEGRIRSDAADAEQVEMRVSTFPTLHGEKVVVRLFVGSGQYRRLGELGLPEEMAGHLRELLLERGGLLLITGPAGSGKTTTAYAALRELADRDVGRSLVSLEDPVEALVEGVAQSQVHPATGFTYETGLRSLLRQDPDVLFVGEIRDPPTAELVFQASLTGHLVLSTFHAQDARTTLRRLEDMGIEPYQVRSGLLAILAQRLLRRLCACARRSRAEEDRLGLPVEEVSLPVGCERCYGSGYVGRRMLAELLLGESLRETGGAVEAVTLRDQACAAVQAGWTSPAEVRRVFGFRSV